MSHFRILSYENVRNVLCLDQPRFWGRGEQTTRCHVPLSISELLALFGARILGSQWIFLQINVKDPCILTFVEVSV